MNTSSAAAIVFACDFTRSAGPPTLAISWRGPIQAGNGAEMAATPGTTKLSTIA